MSNPSRTFQFYLDVMDDLTVDINDRLSAAQEILLWHPGGIDNARYFLRDVLSDTTPHQNPKHDLQARFRAAGLLDRAGDLHD